MLSEQFFERLFVDERFLQLPNRIAIQSSRQWHLEELQNLEPVFDLWKVQPSAPLDQIRAHTSLLNRFAAQAFPQQIDAYR